MQRTEFKGNAITEGVIWKQLLVFFFPILLGTFFQQLYNTADAVIVGQFVGKEALAAVGGATSVLINLLINMFVGLSAGATVVIAQAYGAQKYEGVQKAVHTSVALALVGGAATMVVALLISSFALRAMGTPDELMDYALTYIRIYSIGMIPSFLYNIGSGILRAVGDTRRPLYFLIVACLTNIVLDLLFVVKLKMGVFGVGIATLLSQVISAALILFALIRTDAVYQLVPRNIRFSFDILKDISKVGLPAGLQSDMYAISNILIQSVINSFGTNTIAAWTAFGKVDGFYWMIMGAYGVAITTFVGQNFGAQKYDRIRKSVKVCLGMSFGTAMVVSSLFCAFGKPLLEMFTSDPDVLSIGADVIWMMAPFYFTYIFIEILSGAIRGTGESLLPMLVTCGGVCVLRLVWIFFVLPMDWQLRTVVFSYPLTWAITSLLFIGYYLQGGWLRKRIRLAGFPPEERKKGLFHRTGKT